MPLGKKLVKALVKTFKNKKTKRETYTTESNKCLQASGIVNILNDFFKKAGCS